MRIENGFHLFWNGPFSNWFPAEFVDNGETFCNSEQFFMYEKALFFADFVTAKNILQCTSPEQAKSFGRMVKNYDDFKWADVREAIMYDACLCKFSQSDDLKQYLLDTGDLEIVEASPYDTIWGIGLHETDDRCLDKSKWEGLNLLGKVLMDVRRELKC